MLSVVAITLIAHTQFTRVTALDETCLEDNIGVNVLVSTDLEISTVENADLPDLPAGTRSISYGPSATSCTSFDGVVVIGGAGSLDPTNSFHHYSVGQINAMKLFLDWMNTERGGLTVGDKTYGLRYVWVGDHQSNLHITGAIAHAIRGTHADFTFAGYSSGLSAYAAKQSFAAGKIMMTWGAATPSVHSQNNLTFGFLPPAPIFSSSALAAVAAAADVIDAGLSTSVDQTRCGTGPGSCKSSIRVGFIQADALYTKTNCVAAPGWADEYDLTTARDADGEPLTVTVPKAPSIEETILALTELQDSGVNVVVGCTYSSTGFKIIEALEHMDYSPLSLVITATVDGSAYSDKIESGWWQGEYVLGPAPWTKNAPLVGEFSGLDSPQFAEKYRDRFGDYPVYQAASSYAAISTLCAAIEAAGTLESVQVAAAMRGMRGANSMTEFYTEVNFNDDGQVEPDMFVTQFAPRNATLNIVAPPGSEFGEGLHFPTPTWATRRCRAIGPGHAAGSSAEALSLECSGHGFCSEEGACVCEPTHSGVICDKLIQTLPDSMISRTDAFASISTCIREATAAANFEQTSCTDDFGDSASSGACSYECTTLSAGQDNTVCYISREGQWYAGDNTCGDASCENEEDSSAVFTAAEGSTRRIVIQGANAETQCCHDLNQYHDPLVPLDEQLNTCGLSAELLTVESLSAGCDTYLTQPDECISPVVCGYPCANVHHMETGEALTLSQADLMLRHLQFTGHISTAALNLTRSSVAIHYSSLHNNAAAVHAADTILSVSFSKITGNIASGCCMSPGIVATTQTNIAVDHCDFAENQVTACDAATGCGDGADAYAATGLLVTEESIATVEHSRFHNSRGASAITAARNSELDIQYSTVSNNQVDEDGIYDGHCAGITVISGSSATMSFVALFSNTGVVSGALLVSGSGSTAHTFRSLLHSNRGTTSTLGSGAIAVTSNGTVTINETSIDNNMGTAPTGAGAIFGTDASITVTASLLQNNRVQGNPHSIRGSGAIYSERSETAVADSQVTSNYGAREGGLLPGFSDALHADSPADVKLVDTQYVPFSEQDSVIINPGSHYGRLRGGCQDHPCPLGYECSYSEFSLSCSQCSSQSHSPDGLRCVGCPTGTGPSLDRTTCIPCGGNNYSNFGVCQPCGSQLITSDDHQSCQECPAFQVAIAGEDGQRTCECADEFYAAATTVVCFHDGFDPGHFDASLADSSQSQHCAGCPQDAMGDICLDCKAGRQPSIGAGFTFKALETSRRALSQAGDDVQFAFRCHEDLSIAAKRCPAGLQPGTCAEGYEGIFCGSCAAGYGMSAKQECESCGESGWNTWQTVMTLIALPSVAGAIIYYASKYWLKFSLKHLARSAFQPFRILITYSQVTAQLGDVLDFNFYSICPLFSEVLGALKPLMDIWGLFFRALGPSECFGFHNYTQLWALRIFGLPCVMLVLGFGAYIFNLRTKERETARRIAKTHGFMGIFFCYPTICVVCFASYMCRSIDEDNSVLDADDQVMCEDPEHKMVQIVSGVIIAVVCIGIPLGSAVMLLRSARGYNQTSSNRKTVKSFAEEFGADEKEAEFVIRDISIGQSWSFLMDAYKPQYLYWESLDMARKLALVGLVLFAGRGSIAQLSAAITLSFVFFALQVFTWPYKSVQDNCFRAASEIHVFIVIVTSMVLKHDLTHEVVQSSAYDMILLVSFILLVPCGAIAATCSKMKTVQTTLSESIPLSKHGEARRHAYKLQVLGLSDDVNRDILRRYIAGWQINKKFATFLSHFKNESAAEARILKSQLGDKLRLADDKVFLDADNLNDLRELMGNVADSDSMFILYTNGYFSRPWCLIELMESVKHSIPIIIVNIDNVFKSETSNVSTIFADLPQYLADTNPTAVKTLQDYDYDPDIIAATLKPVLTRADVLNFSPHLSSTVMASQVTSMARAMADHACPENEPLIPEHMIDEDTVWPILNTYATYVIFDQEANEIKDMATELKTWLASHTQLETKHVQLQEQGREKQVTANECRAIDDTDSVVVLQSAGLLSNSRCLALLFMAATSGKQIVPVVIQTNDSEKKHLLYNFEEVKPALNNLQEHLGEAQSAALEAATGSTTAKIGSHLNAIIPNIISKPLAIPNMKQSSDIDAQMAEIAQTLRNAAAKNFSTDSIQLMPSGARP